MQTTDYAFPESFVAVARQSTPQPKWAEFLRTCSGSECDVQTAAAAERLSCRWFKGKDGKLRAFWVG